MAKKKKEKRPPVIANPLPPRPDPEPPPRITEDGFRTPGEIELSKTQIAIWMRRGWTQTRIAEELKVSPATVAYHWKKIVRGSRAIRDRNIESLITVKLEQYSEIIREAWDAWERSKQDAVKVMTESSAFGSKDRETRENQCGDPRYLLVVKQCLDSMSNLLGLNPDREIKMRAEVIRWETLYKSAEEITQRVNPVTAHLQQIQLRLSETVTGRSVEGNIIEGVAVPTAKLLESSEKTDSTKE